MENNLLKIKATILEEFAEKVKARLDIGINLGLSIGGFPEFEGREIVDFTLLEISLTTMPANWDTYGTVEVAKGIFQSNCLGKACYKIKNLQVKEMAEQTGLTEEQVTKIATDLFNELMANEKQGIKDEVLTNVKNDLEKLVDDKIKEYDDNQSGSGSNGGSTDEGTDNVKALLETFGKDLMGKLEESQKTSQEQIEKGIIEYVEKNSNPTPTPTPTPSVKGGKPGELKKFTNKEIIEQAQRRSQKSSIFNLIPHAEE